MTPNLRKLHSDITEILVKSIYCAAYGDSDNGKTALEVLNGQKRAILKYQNDPRFHAVINQQVASIMMAIERNQEPEMQPETESQDEVLLLSLCPGTSQPLPAYLPGRG